MSYDPSKILYTHSCGKLPCECTFEHKPLNHQVFYCKEVECKNKTPFLTINELQEHILDSHSSIPLTVQRTFDAQEHRNGSSS